MKMSWISPLQRFDARDVIGVFRQEGIEHRLVRARRIQPPLDADLLINS